MKKTVFLLHTALLILSMICFTGCSSTKTVPTSKDFNEWTSDSVAKIISAHDIPLIQVAGKIDGKAFFFQVANAEFYPTKTELPDTAIFQAASLSKVVFAYIVMRLADRGEIDLDKPLHLYTDIDRFADKANARKLTAKMVLTHRTGLPNWSASPSSTKWPTSTIDFIHAVDSCFGYSGEGFAFLQRAVEAIKGKGIDKIAREEVFGPLGMSRSSYEWKGCYDTLAVDGFNAKGENKGKGKHPRANVGYTLRSCASDYAKFLDALLNGEGLSDEMAKLMFTPSTGNAVRYAGKHRECDNHIAWAMGLGTEHSPELGKVLWHWGNNSTFKALFVLLPERDSYLVYFTNSNHGHDIINAMTALYFKNKKPLVLNEWIR